MRASGQSDLHKLEALSLGTLADVASYLHRLFFFFGRKPASPSSAGAVAATSSTLSAPP